MARKPLIEHIYTADPSAHVFENKIYIYPSHDQDIDTIDNDNGDQYQMTDYHVFSMERADGPVQDHGVVLHVDDVPWATRQMWAPDAAYKNGKYYLYFPARDKENNFRIGVAISDSPAGPFKAEPDYIKKSFSIDPCSFVDDDGSAYVYFGGLWGGQLEKWTTGVFKAEATEPAPDEPAVCPRVAKLTDNMLEFCEEPQKIQILDEKGAPLLAGDEERRYFEGPWMHKYKGKYYFSYSTGSTHLLAYAVGDSPYGPFTYKGTMLPPVIGWTTHHSIVEFQNKWYLFYHDASLSGGVNHKRCLKMQELKYDAQGNIIPMEP